jgi:hypothetical protein
MLSFVNNSNCELELAAMFRVCRVFNDSIHIFQGLIPVFFFWFVCHSVSTSCGHPDIIVQLKKLLVLEKNT